MNTLIKQQAFFQQSRHRFIQHFLERACEWGAKTRGQDAQIYLSIVQEVYPNVRSALSNALLSLQTNYSDDNLWLLWRSAIAGVYNFYDYRGLWDEIYDLLSDGIREALKRGDAQTEANFLFYQARIDDNQGRPQKALKRAERSLQLFRNIEDVSGVANLLHFHGMLLRQKGDLQGAFENFEKALEMWARLNNADGQASTLYEIGRLEEMKENITKAEHLYRKSLAIFQELNRPREQATLLFQLGGLLGEVAYLNIALQTYKSLMDERGYAQTLHQLGRVWQKKGDQIQARSLYYQALQIFERLGSPRSIQSVNRDLHTLGKNENP